MVSYLDYIGELDRPFVQNELENFLILIKGLKAIEDYPLDTSD